MKRYCFKTDKFKTIKDEDENTNPGVYGLELSKWIEKELKILGYAVEEIISEDWGWCVICKYKPFLLWVGCQGEYINEQLVWCCFAEAEKPIFRNPFKKLDIQESLEKLNKDLFQLLNKNFYLDEQI
jgi:hypothetical protein